MSHNIPRTMSTRAHIYGAPLSNGDLGPSSSRRLLENAHIYRPEETDVEEAGIDRLLEAARRREAVARDAIVGPDYDNENPPTAWPDEDVGELLRLVATGRTMESISQEMGRTHAAVKQKLYSLRKLLAPKTKAQAANMSSRRKGKA